MNKAALGGAAALLVLVGALKAKEGLRTEAYYDPVGVLTICFGETKGVYEGMKLTQKQCEDMLKARAAGFMQNVQGLLKVELPPDTLAAHSHFAYNIGVAGYTRSTTRRLTNEGRLEEGCEAMMNWYRAGGRDCRIKANNCYGLIKRREFERDLCKQGLGR